MTRIASARFDNSPMNYFMKCFFWFNCMHRLITPVHPGSPALARVASAVPIGWNVGWCSATRSDNLPPLAGWALQHKLQMVRSWVITTWVSPMLHLHLQCLNSKSSMINSLPPKDFVSSSRVTSSGIAHIARQQRAKTQQHSKVYQQPATLRYKYSIISII